MRIKFQVVTFDAADLDEESAFWAGVLDGDVDRDDDWHMVAVVGSHELASSTHPTTCALESFSAPIARGWGKKSLPALV